MRPAEYGFNTEISTESLENLWLLGALLHAIFSEVIYDLFKAELINKQILLETEDNREEVLHEFIYERFKYYK